MAYKLAPEPRRAGPADPSPWPRRRRHPPLRARPGPPPQKRSLEAPLSADRKSSHSSLRLPLPHPHLRPHNGPEDAELPPAAPEGGHVAVRNPGRVEPEVTLGSPTEATAPGARTLDGAGRRTRKMGRATLAYGTGLLGREAWSSSHRELAEATRPIRNFLPRTCPPTPSRPVESPREDRSLHPRRGRHLQQVPKELASLWLCRAPGNEIKDLLFLPWVGVSLAPPSLLSLGPRVPPPGCLRLPFPSFERRRAPPGYPARPPGSGAHAHTRAHSHARIQMSTARCWSELLLLSSATRSSVCTTDVRTEPPGANRGGGGRLFLRGSS